MKERPILFSAPMVRALLAGTKTQTRRVVKPQPYIDAQGNFCWNGSNFGQDSRGPHIQALASPLPSSRTGRVRCPYGQPGDRLWVREAFDFLPSGGPDQPQACEIVYWATGSTESRTAPSDYNPMIYGHQKVRPSIHMPRWASRITIEITTVRVERLQDISSSDAIAEGIEACPIGGEWRNYLSHEPNRDALTPRVSFRSLWNSINGPASWDANPWVWAVEFRKVTP